jgi:hypothetical protein
MKPAEAGWVDVEDGEFKEGDLVIYDVNRYHIIEPNSLWIGHSIKDAFKERVYKVLRHVPVPAQEPPAEKREEEWEDVTICSGLLQEGDRVHHRNGFSVPIMGESIGDSVLDWLANPYVTKVTRRVRKQPLVEKRAEKEWLSRATVRLNNPNTCSICGKDVTSWTKDEPDRDTAPDTAAALEVARKALDVATKTLDRVWNMLDNRMLHNNLNIMQVIDAAKREIAEIDKLAGKEA